VLQVGAVRHRLSRDLPEDREALQGVEQAGRAALAEMRHLLDAMREEGERAERGPQPGLDRLDALLQDVGRAGLPVRLHVHGHPERQRRRLHPHRPPPGHGIPLMTIRVLIADDQSMVRAGFRMLLSGEEDIDVVAEARDGREAVEKAARFDPTVVLMDIRMPELDGLQATRRILAADSAARILILTTFDLDEY